MHRNRNDGQELTTELMSLRARTMQERSEDMVIPENSLQKFRVCISKIQSMYLKILPTKMIDI